jgi:hypothetical protein
VGIGICLTGKREETENENIFNVIRKIIGLRYLEWVQDVKRAHKDLGVVTQ